MQTLNFILILVIGLALIAFLFWYFTKLSKSEEQLDFENPYTIKHITAQVAEEFSSALKVNLKEQNLTRKELEARESAKQELRISLKESAYGNPIAKKYIKNFIKDIIRGKAINVTEDTVNNVIAFDNPIRLTPRDKFEIMLYFYMKEYKKDGLIQLIEDYEWLKPKVDEDGDYLYEVTNEEIEEAYKDFIVTIESIDYEDKLEIISQRVFSEYKGFGAADILFDNAIDEVDGGTSGIPFTGYSQQAEDAPYSYECVWIKVHGIDLKLKFLSLESQDELVRICSNVYKHNAPYALSRRNPKVVSTMMDNSRVVVARPPASDSWEFFVRKFDSVGSLVPGKLLADENSIVPITFMKYFIKGYLNIIISGMQAAGKTTTLKSFIRFVPKSENIRIQELAFESNLRQAYPDRNISTLQETDNFTAQEGLDLEKKMNGSYFVFAEVATAEGASWLVQTAQVGNKATIGTHHGKTLRDLIISMRNNLLDAHSGAGFQSERAAEEMVARALNIDFHMESVGGHRFCSRITEIIPIEDTRYPSELPENKDLPLEEKLKLDTLESFRRKTDREVYTSRDLVVFENGRYVFKSMPTEATMQKIRANLKSDEQRALFEAEFNELKKYA
ncbi:ATPase (plasmid) [Butyrivibrio proteoclasticus B316]|uniref:ATPase n=1 Tax=Butyrivibrio proteoclasticus (strain ATCC 51982 / DSM 14932 / B316) TaxID=515622 RepID=E0S4R7_BUTPB|nr:ATPase, T2SS/T4P/T4SS family [Butyrivibrio proteoclasticus]ADL36399.1 ATPase [Butyrivibrio proteoclasticus B316]